jgi:serine/threonine protein kinase
MTTCSITAATMKTPTTHPTGDLLLAFADGSLDGKLADTVESHLLHCDTCLRQLDRSPPLAELEHQLQHASLEPTISPELRDWVDQVKQLSPTMLLDEQRIVRGMASPNHSGDLGEIGRYRILGKLGSGGMGCVFRALHPVTDREVALKVISGRMLEDPNAVARFQREIRAVAKLHHPNIVEAYDAESEGELHFLVMELVEGLDLARLVRRNGPLLPDRAADYVRQAACALQHAFEKGMIHRDVKPANLILGHDGVIKLLDLGLARLRQGIASDATSENSVLGTPDYMAPEQASSPECEDIRGDVYSLGCTLYFLLTGIVPFPNRNTVQKLIAHQMAEPVSLSELRADLPHGLVEIVSRMMAKQPEDRFSTPSEVAQALAPFAEFDGDPDRTCRLTRPAADASDALNDAGLASLSDTDKSAASIATRRHPVAGKPGPLAAPMSTRRRRLTAAIVTAAVLLPLFLGGLIYIQTDTGILEIETIDDNVDVIVRQNGKIVKIVDLSTGWAVEIPSGDYRLALGAGNDAVELDKAGGVKVKRGERTIARIRRKPASLTATGPVDDRFIQAVAELKPQEQVDAVRAKLKQLNPGFDGKFSRVEIGNGEVEVLEFSSDQVKDISPVRALRGLRQLVCGGSNEGLGQLEDLSPLRGMKLSKLAVFWTRVKDLEPLRGMPLKEFFCGGGTQVKDLQPLQGMQLESLWIDKTQITDLRPLNGMPLVYLNCDYSTVSDITPLQGMPLQFFFCTDAPIKDFSPIKEAPLRRVGLKFDPNQHAFLLKIPTLELINGASPAKYAK